MLRRHLAFLSYLILFAGCFAGSTEGTTTKNTLVDETQVEKTGMAPADDGGDLQTCGEPPAEHYELRSYWNLSIPATYWVDMLFSRDAKSWRPAKHIPIPRHHGTRLELQNLAKFPLLAKHSSEEIRFTVAIGAREIHKVPGQRLWRTTYRARVVRLCRKTRVSP